MMDVETWMAGQEAVDLGFATNLAENMKVAARAIDQSRHQYRNIPAALTGRPIYDAAQTRIATMRAKLCQNKLRTA